MDSASVFVVPITILVWISLTVSGSALDRRAVSSAEIDFITKRRQLPDPFPHKLQPSLSCLLLGDSGCACTCELMGLLYGCDTNAECRKGIYCECNEVYHFQKRDVSADDFQTMPLDELWYYRFSKTPASTALLNRVRNDDDVREYVTTLLRKPHLTGEDAQYLLADEFPAFKQIRELEVNTHGMKGELNADGRLEYDHIGDYLSELFAWIGQRISDTVEFRRSKRRLLNLLGNMDDEEDVRSVMRQLLMSGDDRLYNAASKYLRQNRNGFDDDSVYRPRRQCGRRQCGRRRKGCRKRRRCKGRMRPDFDDMNLDVSWHGRPIKKTVCVKKDRGPSMIDADEDEVFEIALINQLLSSSASAALKAKPNTSTTIKEETEKIPTPMTPTLPAMEPMPVPAANIKPIAMETISTPTENTTPFSHDVPRLDEAQNSSIMQEIAAPALMSSGLGNVASSYTMMGGTPDLTIPLGPLIGPMATVQQSISEFETGSGTNQLTPMVSMVSFPSDNLETEMPLQYSTASTLYEGTDSEILPQPLSETIQTINKYTTMAADLAPPQMIDENVSTDVNYLAEQYKQKFANKPYASAIINDLEELSSKPGINVVETVGDIEVMSIPVNTITTMGDNYISPAQQDLLVTDEITQSQPPSATEMSTITWMNSPNNDVTNFVPQQNWIMEQTSNVMVPDETDIVTTNTINTITNGISNSIPSQSWMTEQVSNVATLGQQDKPTATWINSMTDGAANVLPQQSWIIDQTSKVTPSSWFSTSINDINTTTTGLTNPSTQQSWIMNRLTNTIPMSEYQKEIGQNSFIVNESLKSPNTDNKSVDYMTNYSFQTNQLPLPNIQSTGMSTAYNNIYPPTEQPALTNVNAAEYEYITNNAPNPSQGSYSNSYTITQAVPGMANNMNVINTQTNRKMGINENAETNQATIQYQQTKPVVEPPKKRKSLYYFLIDDTGNVVHSAGIDHEQEMEKLATTETSTSATNSYIPYFFSQLAQNGMGSFKTPSIPYLSY